MNAATQPFQFVTASYLPQVENQKANTLEELQGCLEDSSDAAIFYHTFQSLGRHHFLTEGFSNDFAQWVLAGLNRPELAEQLAALDIRGYLALVNLRADLLKLVETFCRENPSELTRPAFEPFYFLESVEVTVPLSWEAWTLEEFRNGLAHLSNASFQYHFIVSRLRLQLQTNDFSHWLSKELGLDALAKKTDQIDIYTNTLDDVRARMFTSIDRELAA